MAAGSEDVVVDEAGTTARWFLAAMALGAGATHLVIHVWIGPDYIDEAPIFAHDHPDLYDGFNPQRDA